MHGGSRLPFYRSSAPSPFSLASYMKLVDYDFHLPPEQIAQHPAAERDQARLLVLNRADGSVRHLQFRDLVDFLRPPDLLVINRTRVMAARLRGRRLETGGKVELLLIRREGENWLAMGRPGRRLQPGVELEFGDGSLRGCVIERVREGRVLVRFQGDDSIEGIEAVGEVPLPPYIRRTPESEDRVRYQTVYARESGAVAAPTAGLHFTPSLLRIAEERSAGVAPVLLHVGPGTFEPVRCEDPSQHQLEAEYCEVDEDSAARIEDCREEGGRVIAVGTTVVRTLETAAEATGSVEPWAGWSAKFICPPYTFRAVDALVTNFHLPRSSLLLLVAALVGRELLMETYRQAVAEGYRFYSYGDAMLIV